MTLSERELQVLRGLQAVGRCYVSASEAGDPELRRLFDLSPLVSVYDEPGPAMRWEITEAGLAALAAHERQVMADLAAMHDEAGGAR